MKYILVVLLLAQIALLASAQTWGTVQPGQRSVVDARVSSTVTTNVTFNIQPDVIRFARATPQPGTLGTTQLLTELLDNSNTATFNFVGNAPGAQFDIRIEIFTSNAIAKSISVLLIGAAFFFVKLVS